MNSIEFEIVEFIKHVPNHKSTFYSILLKGESQSEADKFFERFEDLESRKIEIIAKKIDTMVRVRGCQEYFFDLKQSYLDNNIVSIPQDDLRLYCLRYSNVAVILGGGDYKHVATYQESEELHAHVLLLEKIYKLIDNRIKEGEIIITDNSLEGNLNFKIE